MSTPVIVFGICIVIYIYLLYVLGVSIYQKYYKERRDDHYLS
jgi:hypothetical protein